MAARTDVYRGHEEQFEIQMHVRLSDQCSSSVSTLADPTFRRQIGQGSQRAFSELSSIRKTAMKMLEKLLSDHETVARTCREAFPAAERSGDQPTMDLLTQRMQVHEKTAWMLRSILGR